MIDGRKVTLYGSHYYDDRLAVCGSEVCIDGLATPAIVNSDGLYLTGTDGKKVGCLTLGITLHLPSPLLPLLPSPPLHPPQVLVTQMQMEDGHMIQACQWGKGETHVRLELSSEEMVLRDKIRVRHSVCV